MQHEQMPVVYLKPGEYYIARESCRVETVLGSCVSVTLHCPYTRLGAMNHAMLPEGCDNDRFVTVSLDKMLRSLNTSGANTRQLEAKMFGGANSFYRNEGGFRHVGELNVEASLHWRSSMPRDELVLTMYIRGIESIPSRNSLKFNVDGDLKEFSSIDTFTDFSSEYSSYTSWATVVPTSSSHKRYLVSEEFIKEIIAADHVGVRLNVGTGGYVEGVFSDNTMSAARPAFVRFMERRGKLLDK